jgi:hypothetical protein
MAGQPIRLGPLQGQLDRVDRTVITGRAFSPANPADRVELEVLINDERAGTLVAGTFRADLLTNGIGDGAHAFWLHLPGSLSPHAEHIVRGRRQADGAELRGSPARIPPAEAASPEAPREIITRALTAAAANATAGELDRMIAWLGGQAAELLHRETPSGAPEAAFVARWSAAGADVRADGRPRALFLDERIPDPDRDAGSNAAISHMRALQRLGYRVDFVAEHGLADDPAATRGLQDLGITVWHAPWIASVEEVLRRAGEALDLVYLHRFGLMQRYAALVRRWCPRARVIYCVADLHYLRLARRLAVAAGDTADATLPDEAAGLRTAELLMALAADAVITHSSHELDLLRRDAPEANAHLVLWEVAPQPTAVPFADRNGVAFVGSFGHGPNLDAALFLVEKIMPLVWKQGPQIPCLLVGTDLPAVLRAAAAADRRVEVVGRVPKLAAVWDRVRLSAAPLRFGAGLKGKVLDSLAGGVPCACTAIAAEGADLPAARLDCVGDGAEALAAIILSLHDDAAANEACAAAGLAWVRAHLCAERIDAALAAAVRGETPGQGSSP